MAIIVHYVDIRSKEQIFEKYTSDWQEGITIEMILRDILNPQLAQTIVDDLATNKPEIIVAWYDKLTEDGSEIGGVGTLDAVVGSEWIITISYKDEATSEAQLDASITWMLANDH